MIIDKLDNKVFTSAQIRKRSQFEISAKWSPDVEANLQRKLIGSSLGLYDLSADEQAELTRYKTDLDTIKSEAATAEIDNQLVIDVIEYEKYQDRLSKPLLSDTLDAKVEVKQYNDGAYVGTDIIDNPLIITDVDGRNGVQLLIDGVGQDVVDLAIERVI